MANLLYLVHRMPYPPDKGDKVRSYHLLQHLVQGHRVFVGSFVDDPADEAHVPALRALCAGLHLTRLHRRRARLASLGGLLAGQALTLRYYRSAALQRWVQQTVQREAIDAVVVFSSSMAQYAQGLGLPTLVDFVDVDSAKWTEYAAHHRWPVSWLYRREGRRLLAYERAVALRADHAFFVTEKETALFRRLAPEAAGRCEALCNGVDAGYFAPDPARPSPYAPGELPLVFTGAMDYWPNIDAVGWFVQALLPALRQRWPALRLHIVGRNPAPAVRALAGPAVQVSGTVPDVRPYLQHAAVVVAPLRLARGIQNKILEAMAMARPVVAARECAEAITAERGTELLEAADAAAFVQAIDALLHDPARAAAIGQAGRRRVLQSYGWQAQLQPLDDLLARVQRPPAPQRPPRPRPLTA
ncbi:MAG: TIGR03087 family PEP-CTERM/XrtA system glycosyltransferase [Burkholderiales bacterium]|nr:TIGR03087 family PEP-CTERM/XrtA system glycosyltransferase [Burkholderiales bacterium]